MRRLLRRAVLTLAIAAMGIATAAAGSQPTKGVIRVKLQPEMALKVAQLPSLQTYGKAKTGITPLDRAAEKTKAVSMRPMLPYSAKFAKQRAKHGLDRWYVVSFDESVSPEEARKIYASTAGVEKSELITPMSLVEGNKGFRKLDRSRVKAAAAGTLPFNDPFLGQQWHYQNFGDIPYSVQGADINLFNAWKETTGKKDVVVAIIDGGIDYTHEDLAPNIFINEAELNGTPGVDDDGNGYVDDIYGWNFCTEDAKIYPHSHGTHVAGTVAAVNNNGIGVCGVAGGDGTAGSGVKLLSCQVFDSRSGTKEGDFAAAIVYAAEMGATIGQCSWGWPTAGYYEEAVLDAIDYFTEEAKSDNMKGGLLFFAMGNEGKTGDFYPGAYKPVVGVAAMTAELTPASYSCNGPATDITAPGGLLDYGEPQGVLSTLPGNEYGYNEGTSMATPHVSGTAALILSKYGSPTFLNETLRTQILTSVNDFYGYGNNSSVAGNFGSGYLDATKAVHMDQSGAAPSAVSDFTLTAAQDYINVSWTIPASTDNAVNTHVVYYSKTPFTAESDLTKIPSVTVDTKFLTSGDTHNIDITGLESLTEYHVAIVAVNRWGKSSPLSAVKTISTNAGPKITIDQEMLSMSSTKEQPVASAEFTIGNEADGVLKWKASTRTVEVALHSGRPMPGKMQNAKLDLASAKVSRSAGVVKSEYLADDYPKDLTYCDELWAMIGENDKTLPNALAQWFKVDAEKYPDGFNLTSLYFEAPQTGIFGDSPKISIYKGNVGISQASLITEVKNPFFAYNYNIQLDEQLWFAPGESFWVVAAFEPNQEGYPLPMGRTETAGAASNSFMSIDGGKTWMQLSEALKGSSYEELAANLVWGVKARSFNPDWSKMLELDPASGTVRKGETQKVAIKADGTKLVNGTYHFSVPIATNETGSKEVDLRAVLNVSGNAPQVEVPKVVDFGSLLVGQTKTLDVEFFNKGYGSFSGSQWGPGLYDNNISTSSDNFKGPEYIQGGFPARSKTIVTLTYKPESAGSHTGTVTFTDANGLQVKVLMQGVATEPAKLAVDPSTVDAGTLKLGEEPKELTFSVKNEGKYPLEFVFPKFSDETVEGAAKLHKFGYTVASTLPGFNTFEYAAAPQLIGAKNIASKFTDAVYLSDPVSIGFDFPYYGKSYSKLYITSFGGVTFAPNESEFRSPLAPDSYGVPGTGLISAYGNQLQMGPDSKVEYGLKDGKFTVNFANVLAVVYDQEYAPVSFHLTLSPNGDVEIFYDDYDPMMVFQNGSTLFCGINDPEVEDVVSLTNADMADYWGNEPETPDNSRFRLFATGTAVKFEAPQASFIRSLEPAHGLVAPGEAVEIKATVSVDGNMNAGATFNNLAIVTNDPEPAVSAVRFDAVVDGEGLNPVLSVEDKVIDFGTVFRTSEVLLPVSVKNAGHNVMNFISATFAGGKMTVAPVENDEIKPGSTLDLMVTVPTDTEGEISDVLKISTSAGESEVTISGKVIGCPAASISFNELTETVESGTPLVKTLEIENNGNEPLVYSFVPNDEVAVLVPENEDTSISYAYTTAVDKQTSFDWVDIETNGLGVQNPFRYYEKHDYLEVELPFEFNFYGKKYKKMYVYNTGFVSFTQRRDDKIWPEPPGDFPTGSVFTNIIAPYWGLHSMNTTKTAGTYHYVTDDRAVVSWMEYGNSMNYGVCFQLIMEKNGSFKFQYKGHDQDAVIMGPFGLAGIANEDGTQSIRLADRQISFDNAVLFTPVSENTVKPGEKDEVKLTVNTDRLAGSYYTELLVNTNIPGRENFAIPVNLTITGEAAPVFPAEDVVVEHTIGYRNTDINDFFVQQGIPYHAPFKVANNGNAAFTITNVEFVSPKVEDPYFGGEMDAFMLFAEQPELDWITGEPTGNLTWSPVEQGFFQPMEVGRTPVNFTIPMTTEELMMTPGTYEIPVTFTYMTAADAPEQTKTVNVKFIVTPAPSMTFDRQEIRVKADTDDQKVDERLVIRNEGEYKLTYSLALDPTGVGEETEDIGGGIAPAFMPQRKLAKDAAVSLRELTASSIGKKMKTAENGTPFEVPGDFEYNNALYYAQMPGNNASYNYGTNTEFDVFKAAVHFKAPKAGFNVSHIYMPITIEDKKNVNIRIELVDGTDPAGTDILGTGEITIQSQAKPGTGGYFVIPLDKPAYMNPDEDFYVVVTYPEEVKLPAYLNVKEEPYTEGRYMAWTQEAGWYDVADLFKDQYGSLGFTLSCLETKAGEPWITLLEENAEGEVAIGANKEVKIRVNAAAARMEKNNKAVLVVKTNDPNQPVVNYPVYLDLNGKPVVEAASSKVYAREGEKSEILFTVSDPDNDDLTVSIEDPSAITTLKSGVADTADAEAVITLNEDGTLSVKGATKPVKVKAEMAPDFGQAGIGKIRLNVTDAKNHKGSAIVSYEVEKVNRAPQGADDTNVEVTVGKLSEVVDFGSLFEDPDGDDLTYEMTMPANDFAEAFTTSTGVVFQGKAVGTATAVVTAKDKGGLSATAKVIVTVKETSGIDEIGTDEGGLVRILENPVRESLKLKAAVSDELTFEVYDMAGVMLLRETRTVHAGETLSLSVSGAVNGIHTLRVSAADTAESHRFIKK